MGCGIVPNPNSNFYMCTGEFWDDDGVKYSLGLRQDLNKEEDIFTHISNVRQPEKISELDATCYSGWWGDPTRDLLKRLVCVKDNEFSTSFVQPSNVSDDDRTSINEDRTFVDNNAAKPEDPVITFGEDLDVPAFIRNRRS